MDNDTSSSQIANGNVHMYPFYEQLPRPMFVPRGAGTELDPMIVKPLVPEASPVRDIHKGINHPMKEWLRANPNVEFYRTWNRAGTVKTTTYTNVNIVTTNTVSVTARLEIVID